MRLIPINRGSATFCGSLLTNSSASDFPAARKIRTSLIKSTSCSSNGKCSVQAFLNAGPRGECSLMHIALPHIIPSILGCIVWVFCLVACLVSSACGLASPFSCFACPPLLQHRIFRQVDDSGNTFSNCHTFCML